MRVPIAIAATALCLGCFIGEELERGDELMEQLGPGKGAAKSEPEPAEPPAHASSGPGLRERLGRWWDEATAPAPAPPDPADAVVRCTIRGSVAFMRASDCELRGGHAAPAGSG